MKHKCICCGVSVLLLLLPVIFKLDFSTIATSSEFEIKSGGRSKSIVSPGVTSIAKTLLTFSTITPTGKTHPKPTITPTAINPGCIHRKLSFYEPIDTGRVYHHPPVIQYAKLSASGNPVSLSFRDYMAIMSAYKFLQPERIIIHSYGTITGKFWDQMQRWNRTSVILNKIKRMTAIGGKRFSYISHEADYIKLKGILQYGGVISDFDVIVINGSRLKQKQRISECVLSREGEFVNEGFTSCIKNSSYIREWIEGYHRHYQPQSWIYNACVFPTKLLEDKKSKTCYNLYLDETICLRPNAGKEKFSWLRTNGVDWRSKTAAHYFLKHGFKFEDERLLEENHSFGNVLKYVQNS